MDDVQSRLVLNQQEFMEDETFHVCCGTYNVNGKYPDESLRPWLADLQKRSADEVAVDVYAIGFQEIVDLTTSSFILKTDWDKKEAAWVDAVKEVIDSQVIDSNNNACDMETRTRRKYRLLRKERMYGVMILVFVHDKLPVSEDLAAQAPMGVLGALGNKGSVGVSLKVHETRVCFVSSHFASDAEKVEKRNSDFRNTVKNLIFTSPNSSVLTIEEHDMVFWFGDFNYRVERLSLLETLSKIHANETDQLLKYDQLSIERSAKRVFANYSEGPVRFRPTYKYLIKSDRYEKEATVLNIDSPDSPSLDARSTSSGSSSYLDLSLSRSSNTSLPAANTPPAPPVKAAKLPSWTDRVLWRSNDAARVRQLKYFCANTVTISDHKPVCALFEVRIGRLSVKKLLNRCELASQEEDRRLNEEIARISVDRSELDFGASCCYYDSTTLEIVVKNESSVSRANVSAMFRDESLNSLIDDDDDENDPSSSSSRRPNPAQWLIISPTHRENVAPGEQFTVALTLNLNKHVLAKLATANSLDLRDFVILRCASGNHIFVSVSCTYKPTVMGMSLRALSVLSTSSSSFDEFSKPRLGELQSEIGKFERDLDLAWTAKMGSLEFDKTALSKRSTGQSSFFGNVVSPAKSATSSLTSRKKSSSFTAARPRSKLDTYLHCLTSMRTEIVRNDRFFKNDLPSEYTFLLEHMIGKAMKELTCLESAPGSARGDESVEETKNQMLVYLSARRFDEMLKADYEMELLCELLYDLLYAMPQPLIPVRYFDLCTCAAASYDELVHLLFDFLPKSHVKLFELIVKFLQIFLKCLTSCDSNFDTYLANAIFQIDHRGRSSLLRRPNSLVRSATSDLSSSSGSDNTFVVVKEATYNFIHKFVLGHHKFRYIA